MQTGHELIIVDPLNKSNNVAKSTYHFVNIKMAFMIGFVVSREECECSCHFVRKEEDVNSLNVEHCILKRIFNSVKRFNSQMNSI